MLRIEVMLFSNRESFFELILRLLESMPSSVVSSECSAPRHYHHGYQVSPVPLRQFLRRQSDQSAQNGTSETRRRECLAFESWLGLGLGSLVDLSSLSNPSVSLLGE